MFGIKKMRNQIKELEQFEKSVCKIADDYFEKNAKAELNFSTDGAVDKFYHFVTSVDDKLKHLAKLEEENAELRKENEYLNAHVTKFYEDYKKAEEIIAENNAIINAQAKEIETLAKSKKATAKGGKK